MTARLIAALFLAPCALLAQLELYVVDGASERRITGIYSLGAVEIGGSVDTQFRLRNAGLAVVNLDRLDAAGTGFSLLNGTILPVRLLPGAMIDFTVRFQPLVAGGHSAPLRVNDDSVQLLAKGLAPPLVLLEGAVLTPGAMVDFGSVQRGSTVSRTFVVRNENTDPLRISQLAVSGAGFRPPIGLSAPFTLGPGESAAFEVAWQPQTAGAALGALTVNLVSFRLQGAAIDPPVPRPQIVIEPQTVRSGQQARVSVRLAAQSQVNATGQLRMEFLGPSDPSVGFLAPAGLSATFTVQPGDDAARFGARSDIEFQTGVTAGTIVFTAELGSYRETASLPLTAMPAVIDSAIGVRRTGRLEVTLNGFDNTRSAGPLAFAFLDGSARMLGAGAIRVDATADFQRLFQASDAGGLFTLRAVFPVTGNAALIDSVDVELTNSAGSARRNVKMTE